ncbi:hypothetical protein CWI38_2537p0010, partial [Hamiltosporidium tvaerminnensis]
EFAKKKLFIIFVCLCRNALSRKLNEKHTKVTIHNAADSHTTKNLLFINDIRLLVVESFTLGAMTGAVKEFLMKIAHKNRDKSALKDTFGEDTATLLVVLYLYLARTEPGRGLHSENFRRYLNYIWKKKKKTSIKGINARKKKRASMFCYTQDRNILWVADGVQNSIHLELDVRKCSERLNYTAQ